MAGGALVLNPASVVRRPALRLTAHTDFEGLGAGPWSRRELRLGVTSMRARQHACIMTRTLRDGKSHSPDRALCETSQLCCCFGVAYRVNPCPAQLLSPAELSERPIPAIAAEDYVVAADFAASLLLDLVVHLRGGQPPFAYVQQRDALSSSSFIPTASSVSWPDLREAMLLLRFVFVFVGRHAAMH